MLSDFLGVLGSVSVLPALSLTFTSDESMQTSRTFAGAPLNFESAALGSPTIFEVPSCFQALVPNSRALAENSSLALPVETFSMSETVLSSRARFGVLVLSSLELLAESLSLSDVTSTVPTAVSTFS